MDAESVPGAVRDAGIYHVQTGTWTRRRGPTAALGPDVIYANTTPSGYFTAAGGVGGFAPLSEVIDEGGLPGTTNQDAPLAVNDLYSVNGFEIGYCDNGAPGSGGWRINFYESQAPCTPPATAPNATFDLVGLPAGGCWMITVDLEGGGEFCMEADGGAFAPGWDNDTEFDSFGWSYSYIGTDGTAPAGFLLTGDPQYTEPNYVPNGLPRDGTGTYYGPASLCATPTDDNSTGYLTRDFFWIEDPTGIDSRCAFFGGYRNRNGCGGDQGNPYASYHMQIQADAVEPCVPVLGCGPGSGGISAVYCRSNPNSTGVETCISASGSPVAAANDVTLIATNMPLNAFGFFITSRTQGFVANPAGSQGNLCLSGVIGRFVGPGQIKDSGLQGEIRLSTTSGEWSVQAIPSAMGPYAAMAGITSNFQAWHRDVGGNSNFSSALTVDWN
ncbi:MAG: hypothetical protein AAF957_12465 [Planctomycetota bacterium]